MGFSRVKLVGTGGSSIRVENERTQVAVKDRGLIAENFPVHAVTADAALTNQQVWGSLVGLRAGDLVTNVVLLVNVAAVGTAPTGLYVALYDTTGVQLAVSSNLKSSSVWTATGYAVAALSAPYTVASDGGVYACVLINGTFGTTQPRFFRSAYQAGAASAAAVSGGAAPFVKQTGQATFPTPATFVNDNNSVWFGVN